MRVRVLRDYHAGNRTLRAGEIVEINPRTEEGLLKRGIVMQDKSLNGAKETKTRPIRIVREKYSRR